MYDRILFPYDGSDGADRVFEFVLDVAAAQEATVHVLNVADTNVESLTVTQEGLIDVLEREGNRLVDEAAKRGRDRGVDVVEEVVQGDPYSTIVEYANRHEVDVVVMPTHGRRGLDRLLLGSVTERVVRRSDVPVLTVRPDVEAAYPFEDVLVATDGSDCAAVAVDRAVALALDSGAHLHAISTVEVAALGVDAYSGLELGVLEERADEALDSVTAAATRAGMDEADVTTAAEYGGVHGRIASYVEEHGVDLVVVGTHGRTGFDRYLLGSVAEKLVRTSPVPVLTVREPTAAEE